MQYFECKQTVLGNLSPSGSWKRKIDTNPPPLLYFYPFMDSLHHFINIFSMCDTRSGIWNRCGDYVDFVNVHLFLACLGTIFLKTFWSLVVLILNYLNFSLHEITWNKDDQQFYIQMLLNQLMCLVTQVLQAFKKWEVKVTHPTPLCLCMHGLLVIRTALTKLEWITWLYRPCWLH